MVDGCDFYICHMQGQAAHGRVPVGMVLGQKQWHFDHAWAWYPKNIRRIEISI